MTGTAAPSTTRTRQFVLAAIILAAFAVRYFYVRIAVVDDPLRGDAWQYFCYAWNVLKHGTFSLARPMATSVLPDSFRDPGFPVFVAALMAIRGSGRELYDALLLSQCLLATATVGLYVSLAGRWMGFSAACAVGILLGLWPHLISFAGYVLSETLLGFLLALALWLLDTSLRREFLGAAVAAGLAFAAAALTNAVVLPMAPLLATIMVWRDTSRRLMWIVFLLACVVPPAIWLTRNAMLPASASAGRASINFVQGSWPEYHNAIFGAIQLDDPQAKVKMSEIDAETLAMQSSTSDGWSRISRRLRSDPLRYARWYASKPALLWGWDIAVGQGDIYVFPTFHSLFEDNAVFHAWAGVCYLLNPWLALLAVAGIFFIIRSDDAPVAMRWAAGIILLATAVFSVLQAEPRYAIPYRGMEMLLAVFGAASLARAFAIRRRPASA